MSKYSGIQDWLLGLKGQKSIKISDIDTFADLSFVSVQNAQRLYQTGFETKDRGMKLYLYTMSIEELAKPVLLAEVLPAPNSKWNIDNKRLRKFFDNFFKHPIRQVVMSKYGSLTRERNPDILGYKEWLNADDAEVLEEMRQHSIYSDIKRNTKLVHDPLNHLEAIDEEFLIRLNKFLKERIESFLELYSSRVYARVVFREMSLVKMFPFYQNFLEFLVKYDLTTVATYEEIIRAAEGFNPTPIFVEIPLKPTDNPGEVFVKSFSGVINEDRFAFLKADKEVIEKYARLWIVLGRELMKNKNL